MRSCPYETVHRKKPENVWSKQLVLDLKCALLNLKGGDAATGHMVAEDRGEGQTGEPLGQIGKRADITENTRWTNSEQRLVAEDG